MDDMKKHGEGLAASKKELEASSFLLLILELWVEGL